MAVRTGGDNQRGARAGRTTADRRKTPARHDGKDVAQFAPNFSVYVLPPDAVCLYSEDRKFFLHGELYCALAAAIGASGKSFGALVRELERDFPADKIQEALGRLVERRYVVPASRAPSPAIGRASVCRPRRWRKVSRTAAWGFKRLRCRAPPSSPPPSPAWAFGW
jgi:ribosomal protein S12 methylthiotransferase accessory factor